MNKKLFFAGFALLAAVSFTSCNSDNPIDITNPNGGAAFTPTVTSSDDYDLVFNIKETDDVKKLWDNSVPATVKAVLAKKDSIRVAYNVNNYSLDGKAIEVPNFFQVATDKKVLDIAFIGTFASQALPAPAVGNYFFSVDFDTNLPGAEVNLDLITDVEQMLLQAQNERVTLGGNAIIGTFLVRANTTAQEALKIVDGVYIDAINVINGAISVDSKKQIGAKIISNDEDLNDKGAKVGDLDLFLDRIYVVNDVTGITLRQRSNDHLLMLYFKICKYVGRLVLGKDSEYLNHVLLRDILEHCRYVGIVKLGEFLTKAGVLLGL